MSEFQAQEIQTLPPPAQLSLDPGWLTPMGLVDWYICPWMAERANQLIFPLMLDGKPFLISWEGIGCIPLHQDGPGFHLQGKTGKFNVNLRFRREAGVAHVQGNIGLQQVNYTIDFNQNPIPIQGDTGRFRTNSRIQLTDNGMSFEGESGRFTSRLSGTFEAGRFRFQGGKQGERTELVIVATPEGAELSGFFMESSGNLSVKSEPNKIKATGFVREKNCDYTIELSSDGVAFSGGGAPGDIKASIALTPDGYWVKGRLNPGNHFNYHLKRNS